MPKLEDWIVFPPFNPDIDQDYKLVGKVFHHPRFQNGDDIGTSFIQYQKPDGTIVTKTGSDYRLGKPAVEGEKQALQDVLNMLPIIRQRRARLAHG